MNRRDWLVVGGLSAAALFAGWPRIREWPMFRYLRGDCRWGRRSCG
ncbi:MAG: hypothetical protein K2X46_07035 [Roseomonas sp.]|nr:hypothetical protein [Roseomonas sp.]